MQQRPLHCLDELGWAGGTGEKAVMLQNRPDIVNHEDSSSLFSNAEGCGVNPRQGFQHQGRNQVLQTQSAVSPRESCG